MSSRKSKRKQWFAVRCFAEWTRDPTDATDPDHLYEERITVWQAKTFEKASRLAGRELRDYCLKQPVSGFTFKALRSRQAFLVDGPTPGGT